MPVRPFRVFGRQVTGDPAAVSWTPEQVDVIAVGQGGQPLHFVLTGGGWRPADAGQPPVPLWGQPAVASSGPGRLDVFLCGATDRLYQGRLAGQACEWLPIGPQVSHAEPAVVSWGKGRFDLFARTAANALEHYWYYDRIGLQGPEDQGGPIAGRPAAVATSLYGVHVLVRGCDGLLRRQFCRPFQRSHEWTSTIWLPSGGGFNVCPPTDADGAALFCTADPVALHCRGAGRVENRLLAYARQYDRLLQLEPSGWRGPPRDRVLAEPEVTSDGAGASPYPCRVDVFTAVASGSVGQLTVDLGEDGAASPRWRVLDDERVAAAGRPTVVSPRPGRLDLVFRTSDGELCHGFWGADTDMWNVGG